MNDDENATPPAEMVMFAVAGSAALLSVSVGVVSMPSRRHTAMPARSIPALNVSTTSPVVPVGTAASHSPLLLLLASWLTIAVAETPPTVTLSNVRDAVARATAPIRMYRSDAAVPNACAENVYVVASVPDTADAVSDLVIAI